MPSNANRWIVGASLPILCAAQARSDDQVGFAHETYVEDHSRIAVNTETFLVQKTLSPSLDVTAHGVYDAISGATPTGAPPIDQLSLRRPVTHAPVPNSTITGFTRTIDGISGASKVAASVSHNALPLAQSHDIRRGGDFALGLTLGPGRLTPQFSYSQESDYVSWGGALNYSLELNDKTTVVSTGWSHDYDRVLANRFTYLTSRKIKNTDDFILGISQIVSPKTVVSLTGTIGHAEGYLDDPYRSVVFDESPIDGSGRVLLLGEKRPSTRDSQSFFLSATQAVTPLDASVEASYRFYHDSYGIIASTMGIAWFQKIGQLAYVSPSFRYYRQSAAHFYGIQFPGEPSFDAARVPQYYSSDYRLSFMETFTLGIEGTVHLGERWDLRLGYQRYWMHGLDHQTLQAAYPGASIFTIGLNYTF
jgi:hypothetical protein